jgi:hypothetical protein
MQFWAHVFSSGHASGSAALPQLPHPRLVSFLWWIQCVAESITTAVFLGIHPPAVVHFQVVSLGCTSGELPGVCAAAKPKRVAARSVYEVIAIRDEMRRTKYFLSWVTPRFMHFCRCSSMPARRRVMDRRRTPQYGSSGIRRASIHILVVKMNSPRLGRTVLIMLLAAMLASAS